MTTEIIVKRLALIKFIYSVGVTQSQLFESNACISILSFHDCIDMFMNLTAEKKGLTKGGFLMDHFKKIPELTLEPSIQKINSRRNSLKHNGLLPAKTDIEDSRAITIQFLQENTSLIFGIDFDRVSLVNLIKHDEIRELLIKAETSQQDGRLKQCIEDVAVAFSKLKEIHRKHFSNFPGHTKDTGFSYGYILPTFNGKGIYIDNPFSNDRVLPVSKDKTLPMDDALFVLNDMYRQNFAYIFDAISALNLGVDSNQLILFKKIVPEVVGMWQDGRVDGKYMFGEFNNPELLTLEKTMFAINFVLEFSLKVQSFQV